MDVSNADSGFVVVLLGIVGLAGSVWVAYINRGNTSTPKTIKRILNDNTAPITSLDQAISLMGQELKDKDQRYKLDMQYMHRQLTSTRREVDKLRVLLDAGKMREEEYQKKIEHLRGVCVELSTKLQQMNSGKDNHKRV